MDCPQNEWLSDKEYWRQFSHKIKTQRIPLSGSIELTKRCNLRCVHCYLGDKENIISSKQRELTTGQWIGIIDDITEAGCLYLLITGGEPFLRKDFSDIYRHAKKNGLLVTVFTNGTLITDQIIDLFRELPPFKIEISLYGATAPTYEKITGIKGSHENCLRGIETLLDNGINLWLKTILMTQNSHEFDDIHAIAKKYDVNFRFDPAIFPKYNGDKSPLEMRVLPREVVEKDFSDPDRLRKWKDYFERMKGVAESDSLYKCSAGHNNFYVEAYGQLRPCPMILNFGYDLMTGDFLSGWQKTLPRLKERKTDPALACNQCEMISLCGYCPAFFQLETGAEEVRSEYLCALGRYRFQTLEALNQ